MHKLVHPLEAVIYAAFTDFITPKHLEVDILVTRVGVEDGRSLS